MPNCLSLRLYSKLSGAKLLNNQIKRVSNWSLKQYIKLLPMYSRGIDVHWKITKNINKWISNDWLRSDKDPPSGSSNTMSSFMQRQLISRDIQFFFDGNADSLKHMTHCQMFQKVVSVLPAKIWRLVGCTEMISWYAKLWLSAIAFQICMTYYRRKSTVWPGKLI